MGKSNIEWTDETWNPIVGCSKVSAGCKHCYAERMAKRLVAMGVEKYRGTVDESGRWTGQTNMSHDDLDIPFLWRKPRRVFVNSMSDLFHESIPDETIAKIFHTMALTPRHTYQVLTKRADRMRAWATCPASRCLGLSLPNDEDMVMVSWPHPWPLPNVWLGVSVEDQNAADARIPALLQTPAAVRFLSCEPLLGPLNVSRWLRVRWKCSFCGGYFSDYHEKCPDCSKQGGLSGSHKFNGRKTAPTGISVAQSGIAIDWVICGGESGPGARPMHPDWARSLRDQCQEAAVPFFFKQGSKANWENFKDFDSFPFDLQIRQFPEVAHG